MTEEILDFDALYAERKPKKVRIKGRMFEASAEPSIGSMYDIWKASQEASAAGKDINVGEILEKMRAFLVDVFGAEAEDEIFHMLGQNELMGLITMLMEAYEREGKVPGSNRASRRTGARSKATSNGSTRSISGKRASANGRSAGRVSNA